MSEFINSNLKRVSLHDSKVNNFIHADEKTTIEFDWSFLKSYLEKGIGDPIVMGKTKMTVKGYNNEKFRLDYSGTVGFEDKKAEYILFNDTIFEKWDFILENSTNEESKEFKIGGFYEYNEVFCWIDWSFNYEAITISWDKYILHKDWLKGKMLNE